MLWVQVFDNNNTFVHSQMARVNQSGTWHNIAIPDLTVDLGNTTCEGYVKVTLVNAENLNVWFDDLVIEHSNSADKLEILSWADYYPFGEVMRESCNNDYRYGYQGENAERDRETGWTSFDLRQYDAKIGRWLSTDPKRQYASPYVGMGNDPANAIDPDGGSAWKPDGKGGLIAEAGDNFATLTTYLRGSRDEMKLSEKFHALENWTDARGNKATGALSDNLQGYTFKLNNVYVSALAYAQQYPYKFADAFSPSSGAPESEIKKLDNGLKYNCWGSALAGSQGRPIVLGCGIATPDKFDDELLSKYHPTDKNYMIFGKTVIRFKDKTGVTTHGAVFYGKSNNGTIYVFTKNGWTDKPRILPLKLVENMYGKTDYFNPK